MPHHRAENFARQLQILAVECTANRRRLLCQVNERVQERIVAVDIADQEPASIIVRR